MRLLNAKTRKLEEFNGVVPPYAILSHTWGDEEVSFKDVTNRTDAESMKGYNKIRFTCEQALKDKLEYKVEEALRPRVLNLEIGIDKSSSAELSEAINSMWAHYRKAAVCYVYMADVSSQPDANHKALDSETERQFEKSKWFTRAWTLQELIAPRSLIFYNVDGIQIGTRNGVLVHTIHQITGIPDNILRSGGAPLEEKLDRCSIAKRMSWAAARESTRVEDQAYCLLGLFKINMPMLYGEGSKAFVRLQEEIIKTSTDHSIFVHGPPYKFERQPQRSALFALTPKAFLGTGDIEACAPNKPMESFFMTNRGLQITLPVIEDVSDYPNPSRIVVAMNCRSKRDAITLTLERLTEAPPDPGVPIEFRRAPFWNERINTVDPATSGNRQTIVIVRNGEIYKGGSREL